MILILPYTRVKDAVIDLSLVTSALILHQPSEWTFSATEPSRNEAVGQVNALRPRFMDLSNSVLQIPEPDELIINNHSVRIHYSIIIIHEQPSKIRGNFKYLFTYLWIKLILHKLSNSTIFSWEESL